MMHDFALATQRAAGGRVAPPRRHLRLARFPSHRAPPMSREARAMWVAVIHQALLDATAEPVRRKDASYSTRTQHRILVLNRFRADLWIRGGGRDFREVCALAGIDPDALRDRYIAGQIDMASVRYVYGSIGKGA